MGEQVLLHFFTFQVHHRVLAMHEVLNRQAVTQRVVDSVKTPLEQPGIIQSGLAQALAGNGSGIHKYPARILTELNHADLLAKVGGLGGAFFSRRPGTNYDQVKFLHGDWVCSLGMAIVPALAHASVPASIELARRASYIYEYRFKNGLPSVSNASS